MTITGHLHKVVFGGAIGILDEWSCSLHILNPSAGEIVDSGNIPSALEQWVARTASSINPSAKLDWLKINEINPADGKYVDPNNPRTYYWVADLAGVADVGPPNFTVAVSTMTDQVRGRGSKGRFFPPTSVPSGQHTADGRLYAAYAAGMATSAAQLITDINGGAEGSCVVFSKIGQVAIEITGVRVGRIVDTQNRRRRSLEEDYQSAAIA